MIWCRGAQKMTLGDDNTSSLCAAGEKALNATMRKLERCNQHIDAHTADMFYTLMVGAVVGIFFACVAMFVYDEYMRHTAAVAAFTVGKKERNARWRVFMRARDTRGEYRHGVLPRSLIYVCSATTGDGSAATVRHALACDDVVEMEEGIWGNYTPGCSVVLETHENAPCIYPRHASTACSTGNGQCVGRSYTLKNRLCVSAGGSGLPDAVPHYSAASCSAKPAAAKKCITSPVTVLHDGIAAASDDDDDDDDSAMPVGAQARGTSTSAPHLVCRIPSSTK